MRIEFFFLLVTGISRRAPHSKDGASLSLRVRLNRSPKPQSISYVGSSSGSVCVWPWNCSLRIRTVSETSRRASAVSGGVLAVSSSATCTALPRCARGSICHQLRIRQMDLLFPLSRRNLPEGHPSSAQEIITQIIHSLNANLLCLFPDRVAFAYGDVPGNVEEMEPSRTREETANCEKCCCRPQHKPPRGAWGCGNRRRGKGGGAKVEKDGKAASISRQRAVPTPTPSLPASFHHRPAHLHLKRSLDHHHSDILLLNPQATSPAAMSSRTPFQVAVPKSPCDSVCVFRLSLKATLFGITPERGERESVQPPSSLALVLPKPRSSPSSLSNSVLNAPLTSSAPSPLCGRVPACPLVLPHTRTAPRSFLEAILTLPLMYKTVSKPSFQF
ncbi:hypothetical protein C7M84_016312 [Penaeus vannamei]|uniref:Uncharacterized protein n=1 Tax=Penaeus vannamei TaxID=6689 RepID=A0A3R7Q0W9_PENVA|nr:hypothetical protein C7M84_016312 [Penaeus vannamei]